MGAEPILGFIAAVILLVIVAYVIALRRYSKLLDDTSTPQSDDVSGQVQGRIGARHAAFSLSLPRRSPKRPGELRISLGCSVPLTLSIERKSLSTGFLKAIGIGHDRASGDEELDRRFLFRFDDRAHFRTCLERADLKSALLKLAGLGIGSIWIERGCVTASIPLQFLLPPRVEVVREVLGQLIETASAMESALVGLTPTETSTPAAEAFDDGSPHRVGELAWSPARAKRVALAPPIMIAVFLAAIALASAIAGPMWERGTQSSWQDQVSLMQSRLVIATFVAGGIGLLATYFVGGKPLIWGIGLSWPMLFYTAMIWAYYIIFKTLGGAVFKSMLAGTEDLVTQVLTVLTAAPVLMLLSGWGGARLGLFCRGVMQQRQ